MLKLGCFPQP